MQDLGRLSQLFHETAQAFHTSDGAATRIGAAIDAAADMNALLMRTYPHATRLQILILAYFLAQEVCKQYDADSRAADAQPVVAWSTKIGWN